MYLERELFAREEVDDGQKTMGVYISGGECAQMSEPEHIGRVCLDKASFAVFEGEPHRLRGGHRGRFGGARCRRVGQQRGRPE